jgi:hypothetical protein
MHIEDAQLYNQTLQAGLIQETVDTNRLVMPSQHAILADESQTIVTQETLGILPHLPHVVPNTPEFEEKVIRDIVNFPPQ